MIQSGAFGKKVFFLYPPPVILEVIEELARQEFEVYTTNDHIRLANALPRFPDSILFINLDAGLEEPAWASFVAKLRASAETASVGVGVLSLNDNTAVKQKYLMELQVPCGFVILKIGAAKTAEILAKTLDANEARGRRKHVRALCSTGVATCVVEHDGLQINGELSDLSVVGMAINLPRMDDLKVGTVFKAMTITLRGVRIPAVGFIAARREMPGGPSYIVMFDPASMDEAKREKLSMQIFRINQHYMDRLMGLG
jgi:hypothetical protein